MSITSNNIKSNSVHNKENIGFAVHNAQLKTGTVQASSAFLSQHSHLLKPAMPSKFIESIPSVSSRPSDAAASSSASASPSTSPCPASRLCPPSASSNSTESLSVSLSRHHITRLGRAHQPAVTEDASATALPVQYHKLPRDARHTSRIHAEIQYSPAGGVQSPERKSCFNVRVIGTNGLKIGGMYIPQGAEKRITRQSDGDDIMMLDGVPLESGCDLDFYDCSVSLRYPRSPSPAPMPRLSPLSQFSRLAQEELNSGAKRSFRDDDNETDDDDFEPEQIASEGNCLMLDTAESEPIQPQKRVRVDSMQRCFARSLSFEDTVQQHTPENNDSNSFDFLLSNAPSSDINDFYNARTSSPQPVPMLSSPISSRESTPLPSVDVVDKEELLGLLVTACVFSRTSTTSAEELLVGVLETSPGMLKSNPSKEFWSHQCELLLDSVPMFGKIVRHAKDANLKPLPDLYYYVPKLDADKERSESMGPMVKPVRLTQTKSKRYTDRYSAYK